MPRITDDTPLNHPVLGPEFSVRVGNLLRYHGVHTVGELRARIGALRQWRNLGVKSFAEVAEYLRWADEEPGLPDSPEAVRARLLETIPIIVRDAQNVVNAVIPALAAGRLTSAQHAQAVACLQGALRALEEIKPRP